jgi:hypothetical protein
MKTQITIITKDGIIQDMENIPANIEIKVREHNNLINSTIWTNKNMVVYLHTDNKKKDFEEIKKNIKAYLNEHYTIDKDGKATKDGKLVDPEIIINELCRRNIIGVDELVEMLE